MSAIPAAATNHVFDVEEAHFETDVLEASMATPVLLDFWADWCQPCKTLGPLLEKLAAEYAGAFRLGKVDVEANPQLAGVFGIRSIPTVILLKDGQPLDGFAGALPEAQLREFLGKHLQPLDDVEAADGAETQMSDAAPASAESVRAAIAAHPDQAELRLDLVQALLREGAVAEATGELDALPANLATDARAVRARSQLDLAAALKDAPSQADLARRVAADPTDWAARDLLGVRLLLEDDPAAGLEQFLAILEKQRDWNDGAAKKRLLAAFATLDDAELIGRYRRRMASLLF